MVSFGGVAIDFLSSLIVEDHGLPEDKKKSGEKIEENGENKDGEEAEIQEVEGNREKIDLEGQR